MIFYFGSGLLVTAFTFRDQMDRQIFTSSVAREMVASSMVGVCLFYFDWKPAKFVRLLGKLLISSPP